MNPLIQFRTTTLPFLIALTFACFGPSPITQALLPPPDGGYPFDTTAEGDGALGSLILSGKGRPTAVNNTALGFDTLFNNTGGNSNTATGARALFDNTTGSANTATGYQALFHNTVNGNTADGFEALYSNTTASGNSATGYQALFYNDANANTADGFQALYSNTTGILNSAIGFQALNSNTNGDSNTAMGSGALVNNDTGNGNTAEGFGALGYSKGGSQNTALGENAGSNVTTANNVICIGAGVSGANVNNSCYIGNIWNQPGGSQAVYVNSDGRLGYLTSSRRFKDEIKPIDQASEVVYGLKPVSFRYKSEIEPTRPFGFGLIAEDVERISPDLVTRGGDGKVNSVRYDAVNAMLLNEFLKEHRKVQKLEAALEAVNKRLNEQDAKIQRVSALMELSKPALQMAINN